MEKYRGMMQADVLASRCMYVCKCKRKCTAAAIQNLLCLFAGYTIPENPKLYFGFSGIVFKRLVKSPKVYVRDTGLLHGLLNINSTDELLSHPVAGASWEGYVLEQIAACKNPQLQLHYYRTHDGAECDAVLVKGIKPVACIEIKLSNAPIVSKGYLHCIDDLKPVYKGVVTPQSETYTTQHGVPVTGLKTFLKEQLPLIK